MELLSISSQYDMPRLQLKCESVATKGVDFDNVAYVWRLSKLYQTHKLRDFCQGIILQHYDVVSKTDCFLTLEPEDLLELKKLARK